MFAENMDIKPTVSAHLNWEQTKYPHRKTLAL
jgi:hypothetical protein